MITEPFPGYSWKRFRDHENVALAPHGWAGFHRTAGQFPPQCPGTPRGSRPAAPNRHQFRPHRTIPPRDSQQIIAASPPVEAGTMVAAGAFGNRPTESAVEYKDAVAGLGARQTDGLEAVAQAGADDSKRS